MNDNSEVKKRIERLKKEMEDYIKLAPLIELSDATKSKRIDMYLDDLSKLLKQLN